jgi:UDP-N-acetyl-D-mannosaminuronic acid transferase (WecB/TagA/CpsF family)
MALVLSLGGLQQLQGRLPAPALVQEFVNHGGQQYKVYVLGEQVGVTTPACVCFEAAVLT